MTWKSSEEFRLIHEDYQRARKGISTIYSDHFEALSDGRRQLTIILSIPVLGMLAIVLGLPPQLSAEHSEPRCHGVILPRHHDRSMVLPQAFRQDVRQPLRSINRRRNQEYSH